MTSMPGYERPEEPVYSDRRARFRFASSSFPCEETEQTIYRRFEKLAAEDNVRIAVKTADLEWTFQDLHKKADRIARLIIQEERVRPERVALLFGQSPGSLSAMLGALKAGKTYVPISSSNPPARIEMVMDDAQATLLLTDNQTLKKAQEVAGDHIRVLNIDEIEESVSDYDRDSSVTPESVACILYTSGSTGRPKGVMQTHRNILHQACSYSHKIGIAASDRLSLLPSFDVGAGHLDIYAGLLSRATLSLFNAREEGAQALIEWLLRERITVYHSTPALFRSVSGNIPEGTAFPDLRVINLGGDRVVLSDVELFRRYYRRASIFMNSLACTEAGPYAQYFIDHDSQIEKERIPVGYPAEDVEILLRDERGALLSGAGSGEILIRSRYLSPGYWQRPAMTDAVFRSDPDAPGQRIYETGDLGLRDLEGRLEFIGRRDSLVKIRGYRVELPEIESALQGHPAIKEAAVAAFDDNAGNKYLTAYVVAAPGQPAEVESLRVYLEAILPDYMLPSRYAFLEALPKTPNGKVDRSALRPAGLEAMRRNGQRRPSEDPVTQRLLEVWRQMLKVDRIGVNDSFFVIGGDSLAAIDLSCWIEKEYGMRLSPSVIYTNPTIDRLAALISGTVKVAAPSGIVRLRMDGTRPPLFVIPNILGNMLIYSGMLKKIGPDQPVYGVEMTEGDLDRPIEAAAAQYVERIREICPAGPYLLVGFSSGGIFAIELARRLSGLGLPVPMVAMIDTLWPVYSKSRLQCPWMTSAALFFRNLPQWLYYYFPYWIQYYSGAARNKNIRDYYEEARRRNLAVRSWLSNYAIEPYGGRVVFFKAEAQALFKADFYIGWQHQCRAMEIRTIPGTHLTMMNEPNVGYLADRINEELGMAVGRC